MVSGLIIGDTNPEGNESFTLTVTPTADGGYPSYVLFASGTVTIIDDDQAQASQFHVEGLSLLEGDLGSTTAEVRVLLEPASTNTVTVTYQTVDVTATAGSDYLAASGKLTFAPGEVLKTIPITILGDTVPESDETFAVVLSQPTMALLGTARGEVVIANDDRVVHASIADVQVDEGNDGVNSVPLTIDFDGPTPASAKVQLDFVGATATTFDFVAVPTVLYPPAGSTQMTFTVDIIGDTQPECDEGLLIRYTLRYTGDETTKVAKLLIRNDDGPVQGCSDPFASSPGVEVALDGGATVVGTVDAGGKATPDAGPGADALSSAAASDAQPVSDPGIVTQPGPDSGVAAPLTGDFVVEPGCSCSVTGPAHHSGFLLLAVLGVSLARVRRRRSGQ
jgi:MYXO-CTERM domain-containing protein